MLEWRNDRATLLRATPGSLYGRSRGTLEMSLTTAQSLDQSSPRETVEQRKELPHDAMPVDHHVSALHDLEEPDEIWCARPVDRGSTASCQEAVAPARAIGDKPAAARLCVDVRLPIYFLQDFNQC